MRKTFIKLLCAIPVILCLFDSGVMATGIIALISNQAIYVDGQRVEITSYNIDDNNYVRLRDLGKAVDFGVFYDHITDSVRIDRSMRYISAENESFTSPTILSPFIPLSYAPSAHK